MQRPRFTQKSKKPQNYTNLDESDDTYRQPRNENAFPDSPDFKQERMMQTFQREPQRPYRNDSPTKSILKNYDDIKMVNPLF